MTKIIAHPPTSALTDYYERSSTCPLSSHRIYTGDLHRNMLSRHPQRTFPFHSSASLCRALWSGGGCSKWIMANVHEIRWTWNTACSGKGILLHLLPSLLGGWLCYYWKARVKLQGELPATRRRRCLVSRDLNFITRWWGWWQSNNSLVSSTRSRSLKRRRWYRRRRRRRRRVTK